MREPFYDYDGIAIYHGDAADVLAEMPDASADLIFTDPPYAREHEHVWSILADHAARILKPGKSLLTYCGHYQVPRVVDVLCRSLRWKWLCIVENPGTQPVLHGVKVKVCFKPILWLTNGKGEKRRFMRDSFTIQRGSFAAAKASHGWGQAVTMEPLLCLTDEGDVVVDPFLGSGTTLRAAKEMRRRGIGIEIDEHYCQVAADRMRQEVLFK